MKKPINIIDLFAGPGGLGEGFSAFKTSKNKYPFKIKASIEKEPSAHKTLQLRAFCRQFRGKGLPDEYYDYLRHATDSYKSKELTKLKEALFDKHKQQSIDAIEETLGGPQTLGSPTSDKLINKKLSELLKEHKDEDFVVIGGPPCQAYSLAGRSRMSGIDGYRIEDDNRASLYKEYLKALHKVQPSIFVMENVKGILSAKLDGKKLFPQILEHLRDPAKALKKSTKNKYHIYSLVTPADGSDENGSPLYNDARSFVIKAEEYGVPQTRHRVILLGVKSGITTKPAILKKTKRSIPVKAVIETMPKLRSGISKSKGDDSEKWFRKVRMACKYLINKLNNKDSNDHVAQIKTHLNKIKSNQSRGNRFVHSDHNGFHNTFNFNNTLKEWIYDKNLKGFPNHYSKQHMYADLKRYMWISTYAIEKFNSPKSSDFPDFLAPNHKNWKTGDHADRFKVQVANKPASTITCHLSKDGHSSIHYDPEQCRSLTVREAARIQTFPDNYFFEGTRTEQYVQVGNAVPPFLATQIASIIYNIIDES